ncbi:Cell cycle serine/threonine-protein kinase cdc5/MSD2 [Turnera subulata]|uniref:Cell cycle serine/threonine-protein kinase cdc5/MSD2 n=1 Tax=Turnera subulata TaxID=218843 RepID=A0A9Q0G9Z9_9ROSI|nr:Cell cycle serine/threonine-protein kinase cdc5/MSD2 [Turnera subulata]
MDEDEKEMLSGARARLANTRGKKAKRKAREKQLEEARRLASLQKRRELKAAGIDTRQRKRRRKGMDYNSEIPFEKRPPPGFYDVADEDRPVEQPQFPTTIEEVEGKRRVDNIEAQLREQDIAKNKLAQRQDAPEAVRKRSKLMLPAPQIPDHELEEIASDLLGNEELAEGSGATRVTSDFSGVTPKKKEIQTPNPIATPSATPGVTGLTPRIGMTPSRDGGYSFGMTPKGTPLRDELHINDDMDIHDSAKLEQRMRTGLGSPPQPKNEYQIVIQPPPEDNEEPEEKIEEDMSDKIARQKG